jgi:hypothetical protein
VDETARNSLQATIHLPQNMLLSMPIILILDKAENMEATRRKFVGHKMTTLL